MRKGWPSRLRAALQAVQVLGQRLVVVILPIWLNHGDDRVRVHEPRDVVDVAVRVVAGDAAVQPEHLIDAEIVVEGLLQLLAADAGIALLHRAQQAFFRGEQQACAVDVDTAAFEHQIVRRAIRQRDDGAASGETSNSRRTAGSGRPAASRRISPRR